MLLGSDFVFALLIFTIVSTVSLVICHSHLTHVYERAFLSNLDSLAITPYKKFSSMRLHSQYVCIK